MAAVCIVQLTMSEVHSRTTCDFYPIHGGIQNWYYESFFHQPTNNGHGTNIFGRRSFSYVRNCQYTGSYKNYGGKHLILVFCPDSVMQGRIWVDITSGHCAPQDCCLMPATTVKSIQTTQTTGQQTISSVQNIQSTLTAKQQTIPALKQCVDEQFVNCQDPDICQSPFSGRCPLSCKLCVPITTQEPCADSKFVNCQDHMVCSSPVSQYCPVSCGTCGSKSTMQVTTAKTSTATGWLFITR
ncbi:uncharacterized protein [Mytilus edulis]|uniref:ShKT domain-containing protein n=1 Tax=Mytilus edulis TaxID=6550 RepID=A0A8S3VB21_MYTED|nr:unnamed protein product [Mytilus edulis]